MSGLSQRLRTRRRIRRHSRLDFGLGLALLLGLALAGCDDQSESEKVDYGPQADPAVISKALNDPIANIDPTGIKVGEFRATQSTQEIAGVTGKQVVSAEGVTIISRTEQPNYILLGTVVAKNTMRNDGGMDKVSREGQVCVPKVSGGCDSPTSLSASVSEVTSYANPAKLVEKAVQSLANTATFHRLVVSDAVVAAPQAVQLRPNCVGLPSCQIHAFYVSFDQVTWSGGKGSKVHLDVTLSPTVPYLSNQLETCYTGLVNVGTGGSRVLVKQCSTIYDFRFQDDPSPTTP